MRPDVPHNSAHFYIIDLGVVAPGGANALNATHARENLGLADWSDFRSGSRKMAPLLRSDPGTLDGSRRRRGVAEPARR